MILKTTACLLNEHVIDELQNNIVNSDKFKKLLSIMNGYYDLGSGAGKGNITIFKHHEFNYNDIYYEIGRSGKCYRSYDNMTKTLLRVDSPSLNTGGSAKYNLKALEQYYNDSIDAITRDFETLPEQEAAVIVKINKLPKEYKQRAFKYLFQDPKECYYVKDEQIKEFYKWHAFKLYKFLLNRCH
jgi:hypothetical protein